MESSIVQWVISQGIGAVLALSMFLLYRRDTQQSAARLSETAEAYMKFGQEYSRSLTMVAANLEHQGRVLERVEQSIARASVCPISKLSDVELGRRRQLEAIRDAVVLEDADDG